MNGMSKLGVPAIIAALAIIVATLEVDEQVRRGGDTPQQAAVVVDPISEELHRDSIRFGDLQAMANALQAYRLSSPYAVYPSTGGLIQTVCAYAEDVGCLLFPLVPLDPEGLHYYWQSDGKMFTLYAKRSSGESIPCFEQPAHLAELGSIVCIRS